MSAGLKKPSAYDSLSPELQQENINEVRRLIGPQSGKLALYCSDASISRYLRARNWNVKKAVKMLKATLNWRLEFKPEEIHWDDVAMEAETGKIYRSSYKDKYGRPVLIMRPRCQNSKSIKGQIKYLVYCMENAIIDLPQDEEQMIWLIDFHGFNLSNISIKITRETAHVLQEHYPERLGVAFDSILWDVSFQIAKLFLEPKTANKVRFVYSDNPNTSMIMNDLFDMELVESAFRGKDDADFEITKYAERMREDDEKIASFWTIGGCMTTTPLATVVAVAAPSSENLNSEEAGVRPEKTSSPHVEDDDKSVDESAAPVKNIFVIAGKEPVMNTSFLGRNVTG